MSQNKKTPRLDLSFHYDSEADILYASVGKPKPAKNIDFPNGIVLRIDPDLPPKNGSNYYIRILGG